MFVLTVYTSKNAFSLKLSKPVKLPDACGVGFVSEASVAESLFLDFPELEPE